MSVENALPLVLRQFRALLGGKATGTQHVCPAGRFHAAEPSRRLVDQPEAAFAYRPVEVEWTAEASPDTSQPVSGNLIDVEAQVMVRVGYLVGADIESVQDEMYSDARLIRRVLEEPGNYDSAVTGLMTVERVGSKTQFDPASGDRRGLLEMTFRVLYREDQPASAA